jgi:proline iminopeptidase
MSKLNHNELINKYEITILMTSLFPSITPFKTEMLDVSDGHSVYLEQSGSPDGIPVVVLHGGPGAGIGTEYRRFFDPNKYWIIGFDQRGCGQSLPFGELNHNTSQHLVDDVLAIQQHLGIDKWLLFGGSWGSTLALLVAIAAPAKVSGMILRGVFLGREQDYQWYLDPKGGAAQLFPDYYQAFLKPVEAMLGRRSIVDAYSSVLSGSNDIQKMAAIKAWCLWEARISRLHTEYSEEDLSDNLNRAISLALLECHYIVNKCFVPENYILEHADKLAGIPGTIVHGRYDCVCKVESAYALSQAWQESQLHIIPNAGHSSAEQGVTKALCQATQAMVKFFEEKQ